MESKMVNNIFHQLQAGEGDLQLICFPYLGGYAYSFLQLVDELDHTIEVWGITPPGHGTCKLEPMSDIQSLVDLYYKKLQDIIKPNCIFFGHSMGAIVAYFLAERILHSEEYTAKPSALVLSACDTPSNFETKAQSLLPNDQLIELLVSYDGISDELINEKNLLEFFIPIYRADFKVLESSAKQHFTPLDIPVYFLWGEKDKIVPLESIVRWLHYFSNQINIIPIKNASHMFIHDQPAIIATYLEEINSSVFNF